MSDLEATPISWALEDEDGDRFDFLIGALEAEGLGYEEREPSDGYQRQIWCQCPAHHGDRLNAGAAMCNDGSIIAWCRVGCSMEEILTAIGWELAHRYPDGPMPPVPDCGSFDDDEDTGSNYAWRVPEIEEEDENPDKNPFKSERSEGNSDQKAPESEKSGPESSESGKSASESQENRESTSKTPEKTRHHYRDASGRLKFIVDRTEDKEFPRATVIYDDDGKAIRLEPKIVGQRILYNLDKIAAASLDEPVIVAEGEKDADTLVKAGFLATTVMGGGEVKWEPQYTRSLKGRQVILLHDADKPGRGRARKHLKALKGRIPALWLRLPGLNAICEGADVSDWLDEENGHSVEELRELVRAALAALAGGRETYGVDEGEAPIQFDTFSFGAEYGTDELRAIRPRHHLIQGVLPTDSVSLLAGFTNSGKSTIALDMLLHYSAGMNWHGQALDAKRRSGDPDAAGDIVWMAGEGLQNLRDMVEGWMLEHPDAELAARFHIISPAFEVASEPQREALVEKVMAKLMGRRLAVLVIDTLNKHISGDPDQTADMTKFMRGLDQLRMSFPGVVVLVPCHTGWMERGRPRGSSVQVGDCETVWTLEVQGEEPTATVKMSAFKDKGGAMPPRSWRIERREGKRAGQGEDEGKEVTFTYPKLIPVEGGTDDDGWRGPDDITDEQRGTVLAMTAPIGKWLSSEEIVERRGTTLRTIQRHLTVLTEQGLVEGRSAKGPYRLSLQGRRANPKTRQMDDLSPEEEPIRL